MRNRVILGICIVCLAPLLAFAQIGEFTDGISVGDDGGIGMAEFANGVYTIEASGNDIWGANDGFYWVYREMSGSWSITVNLAWNEARAVRDTPDEWRKMGIMARVTPDDPGSRNIMGLLRDDLGANLQWRTESGGESSDPGLVGKDANDTDTIRLMRVMDTFTLMRLQTDGTFRTIHSQTLNLPNTLHVGLAVTAHDTGKIEAADFSNLVIEDIPLAVQASRAMPQETFTGGQEVSGIQITIEVEEGESGDLVVTERIPEGWTLTASNPTATQDGRNVVWDLPDSSGTVTLTYSVRVPDGESEGVLFSGSVDAAGAIFGIGGTVGLDVEGADQAWAPLLTNEVTLDGVISPGEWDGAYVFNFHRENQRAPGVLLAGPAYPREESNLTVYVFHDEEFIYVAMDMVDPVLAFDVNTEVWQDDSVELYIDGNLSRNAEKENGPFGFQATVQGDGHRAAGNDSPTPIPLDNGGFYSEDGWYWNFGARVKDDESGYIVEYKVDKFQVLDPHSRVIIGFDIGVNDNDGTPDRHGKWAWWHFDADTGGRVDAWNDERGWGILELLPTAELPGVPDWTLY